MTGGDRITILDPIGPVREIHFDRAPRLEGGPLRIAILENSKPNADRLLRGVGDWLVGEVGGSIVHHLVKPSPASPAADAWYEVIAKEADLALTGSGD